MLVNENQPHRSRDLLPSLEELFCSAGKRARQLVILLLGWEEKFSHERLCLAKVKDVSLAIKIITLSQRMKKVANLRRSDCGISIQASNKRAHP